MVNILSNAQLLEEEAALEQAEEEANVPEEVMDGIAQHINKCWEAARDNKAAVKERIFAAQRSRRGEYDPQKLAAIRATTGGSEEFGRIVGNKCRIAESWLRDVYLGQIQKAWTLSHSPNPELPPEAMQEVETQLHKEIVEVTAATGEPPNQTMLQSRRNELHDAVRMRIKEEAKLAIERMEEKMADQLLEANWEEQWADFLNDMTTYPAAHFKGPVYRRKPVTGWKQDDDGEWVPKVVEEIIPTFERICPLRAYPSPGAVTPQDGFFIEHITLERSELYDLIGVDGYDEDAIRAVLEEAVGGRGQSWLGLTDAQQMENERSDHTYLSPDPRIDCVEYSGPISGRDLLDWGIAEKHIDDPDREYEVTAWLIHRHVIKAQLNPHPTGHRPIYKACWEDIPGEYWGQGLPDSLRDIEGVTNACIRALVNNMAMASGPQVVINVDRLPPGQEVESLTPWKLWQIQDSDYAGAGSPVDFFQPDTNAQALLTVLDKFTQMADDWSLIPRYMGGSDGIAGGIGRTASGMSMLFNAANKGLKGVVSNIDGCVLSPMLNALYNLNMKYEDDSTLKGDAQVEARGAISLLQIETLQLRRNEFLQATANPLDSQIVGMEGRAEILREIAKGLEMDVNRVVPRRGEAAQQPPLAVDPTGKPQQQVGGGQQLANGAAVTDNFSPPPTA